MTHETIALGTTYFYNGESIDYYSISNTKEMCLTCDRDSHTIGTIDFLPGRLSVYMCHDCYKLVLDIQ